VSTVSSAGELHSIFFLDDSIGYICGGVRYDYGVLLKTTDGGHTWSVPDSVIPKVAYTNFFFDQQQGFVAGFGSFFAFTNDSAKSFNVTSAVNSIPINDIRFIDRMHGVIAAGGSYGSGYIAYTSDGGTTWAQTDYPNNFRAVRYVDSSTAFASGYGVIYKSTNGGATFSPLNIRGDFFVDMDFPTPTTGYFVGYQGMILKTTDGGNSFKKVHTENLPLGPREHFEAVDFWDTETGYAVGDAGSMYVTTNGGGKWRKVKSFTDVNLRAVHLFSASSGIVAGDNGKIFLFKE
jgi:photosystem II stability/assembly factor-like uncharacterized protein